MADQPKSFGIPPNGRIVHPNRYHAAAACEHCEGIIRHACWCIVLNPRVRYAYQMFNKGAMSTKDERFLNGMKIKW